MTGIETVLGIVIRDFNDCWKNAKASGFSKELFQDPRHKKIAECIEAMADKGMPVDMATICEMVPKDLVGLVIDLTTNAPWSINYEFIIHQTAKWQKLKVMFTELVTMASNGYRALISESYEGYIYHINEITKKMNALVEESRTTYSRPEIAEAGIDRIRDRIEDSIEGKKSGYLTNIKALDACLSGLQPGRVYVVAARTSVGKTTFSAFLALEAMKQGANPLFFTNEMDKEDLFEKWVSNLGKVSNQALQSGNFTNEQLDRFSFGCAEFSKLNCMADEKSGWNLDQLISVAHRSKSKSGADLIIVDYLQQVRVKGSTTKQEQVSKASDELKKLARDLNVPVIVLAQINRESEKSGKPMMPSLANLKDSGSIEQDADVVMILHKEDISLKEVELFVAKNRYGKTGTIKLNHIFAINSYEESND